MKTTTEMNSLIHTRIAQTALRHKDYLRCYESCIKLIESDYVKIWEVCQELALSDDYQDFEARVNVVCIMTFCG